MKKFFNILSFLCFGIVAGQTTFQSPFTEFLNTGEIEPFERTISIFPTVIKITSTTEGGGKVIQTLLIEDVIDFQKGDNLLIKTYYCTSKDEQTLYQVNVPIMENVDQILLTQYNLSTREAHDLRFLIDSQKALPIENVRYF